MNVFKLLKSLVESNLKNVSATESGPAFTVVATIPDNESWSKVALFFSTFDTRVFTLLTRSSVATSIGVNITSRVLLWSTLIRTLIKGNECSVTKIVFLLNWFSNAPWADPEFVNGLSMTNSFKFCCLSYSVTFDSKIEARKRTMISESNKKAV